MTHMSHLGLTSGRLVTLQALLPQHTPDWKRRMGRLKTQTWVSRERRVGVGGVGGESDQMHFMKFSVRKVLSTTKYY